MFKRVLGETLLHQAAAIPGNLVKSNCCLRPARTRMRKMLPAIPPRIGRPSATKIRPWSRHCGPPEENNP